jgi:hypothetical protein
MQLSWDGTDRMGAGTVTHVELTGPMPVTDRLSVTAICSTRSSTAPHIMGHRNNRLWATVETARRRSSVVKELQRGGEWEMEWTMKFGWPGAVAVYIRHLPERATLAFLDGVVVLVPLV